MFEILEIIFSYRITKILISPEYHTKIIMEWKLKPEEEKIFTVSRLIKGIMFLDGDFPIKLIDLTIEDIREVHYTLERIRYKYPENYFAILPFQITENNEHTVCLCQNYPGMPEDSIHILNIPLNK